MRRCFDIVISAIGLILFSPLLMAIGIAILLLDGFPVLFHQVRVGREGRHFRILKFRSMRTCAPGASITAGSDPRITKTGRLIRRYKLDELPQLWNVLCGDMSFIGPRPEVPKFVDMADATWKKVLSVRPGITEIASLAYRDEEAMLSGYEDPEWHYRQTILPAKLQLSLRYIENRCFWLDLKILILTVASCFFPELLNHQRLIKALRP